MQVHLYAAVEHYADHLLPIWNALPAEARGRRWSPRHGDPWADEMLTHPNNRADGLVLVAGYGDAAKMAPQHRLVFLEHGAGQSYPGDVRSDSHPSYAGGASSAFASVALFLGPGEHVAGRFRAQHPHAPAVAVGCPKLDPWHSGTRRRPATRGPVVAVTFHWSCQLVPETMGALPHFQSALRRLRNMVRARGGELLGAGHPRDWRKLRGMWQTLGVPCTPRLSDVFDQADVLVGDNSSSLYEFASLDRPVVVMNAPWYRKDVEHGLRFWSHVPGVQVDAAADLPDAVADALDCPGLGAGLRRRASEHVYAQRDGRAASRAAAAIMEVLRAESESSPQPAAAV